MIVLDASAAVEWLLQTKLTTDKAPRFNAVRLLRSLLPATTQSLIKLDQGDEFISLRLSQR
jgi:hypothetical protein